MHTFVHYLIHLNSVQLLLHLWKQFKSYMETQRLDPIFTGNIWTKLFSCLRTQLDHSSSYHPQSNGQTEIVNKCLEGYLHCVVSDKQTQLGQMVASG